MSIENYFVRIEKKVKKVIKNYKRLRIKNYHNDKYIYVIS